MNTQDESPPDKRLFKRDAHLMTLVSVCWSAFSILSAAFFKDAWRTGNRTIIYGAFAAWGLHILFIAVAVRKWRTEQPSSFPEELDE